MTRKKSEKTSKDSNTFEPNKVAFGVAAVGALVLLVMAVMMVTSILV